MEMQRTSLIKRIGICTMWHGIPTGPSRGWLQGGNEKQLESVSRPTISSALPFSSPSPSGTLAFLLPPICNKTCSQERLCSHSFRFLTGTWNKRPQNHVRNTVAREAEIMVSFIFKSEEHRWMKQTHWKFLSQAEKHMINNSEGK